MGKNYKNAKEKVTQETYGLEDAFKLVPETKVAKFDETVDVAVKLGVDVKHADQQIRGTVILPNGTGKDVKILVFAKGEKEAEAKEAGADYVGADDMVAKINGGWLDFDAIVSTPDMMATVGKLGKVLGPRGLMPNPKVGTVTFDVAKAVKEIKSGKIEFRTDKAGNLHAPIGKVSFGGDKLKENFAAFMETVIKLKPTTSKGIFLKSVNISTTMGPGINIDLNEVRNTFK